MWYGEEVEMVDEGDGRCCRCGGSPWSSAYEAENGRRHACAQPLPPSCLRCVRVVTRMPPSMWLLCCGHAAEARTLARAQRLHIALGQSCSHLLPLFCMCVFLSAGACFSCLHAPGLELVEAAMPSPSSRPPRHTAGSLRRPHVKLWHGSRPLANNTEQRGLLASPQRNKDKDSRRGSIHNHITATAITMIVAAFVITITMLVVIGVGL
ncbi:unnamed protein product [Prorocentrum cordatum]|uniref:Uncharacterized protein n=1 Tax=Prorocentrum cordatum TaxID=2364126 RepID=A0ABN9S7R6_9DINO|nr:unnamed protein product [Polarella glacialis]